MVKTKTELERISKSNSPNHASPPMKSPTPIQDIMINTQSGLTKNFEPQDERVNIAEVKNNLTIYEDHMPVPLFNNNSTLPIIAEHSQEWEDENLQSKGLGEVKDGEAISNKKYENQNREKTTAEYSEEEEKLEGTLADITEGDFIDLSQISDDGDEVSATNKLIKKKWWLINPESQLKCYWNYFICLLIVVSSLYFYSSKPN